MNKSAYFWSFDGIAFSWTNLTSQLSKRFYVFVNFFEAKQPGQTQHQRYVRSLKLRILFKEWLFSVNSEDKHDHSDMKGNSLKRYMSIRFWHTCVTIGVL